MDPDQFCTYFDHRYAALGIAMLRSLRRHGGVGPVWVLCLDPQAEWIVNGAGLENVKAVSLANLEMHFPELGACKANRTTIEYYFTLTPHIVRFVFDQAPGARRVAYLDCDLFFFGVVGAVWAAMAEAPVAIIPHNFHDSVRHLAKYGEYNVGWVSFSRSDQGMKCLDFWAAGCRNWCYDFREEGRFADQGYLDDFYKFAPDLAILRHKGFNLAPWNVGQYDIHLAGDEVRVDEAPLIFFHFTGFKKGFAGRWFNSHRGYRTRTTRVMRDQIYRPYLAELMVARTDVSSWSVGAPELPEKHLALKPKRRTATLRARAYWFLERLFWAMDILTGQAIRESQANRRPSKS
jgi:hypothetical protein